MKSPKEYYREQHPNEFSDSRVEEITDYDREVIDFALSSITTNNQEQAFEKFSLRVCEIRVCANLVPNTGPAGGGDGKVDADTFPVSDSVDTKYYEGIGRQVTNERWAFAFSAKQAWKQKLQSDINSILSTKRPYGQIIFVTNQSIPSKNRQKVQDDLSAQHGIPVTILDRTWLIDSIVYHNCARFAVEELGLNSAQRFNVLPGPSDQQKRDRLNKLLGQINDDSENKPSFLSVEHALLAAKIARTLEQPQPEVEMLFQGARKHALSRGTDAQRTEVEYQLAWTQFWWYEDYVGFLSSYKAFIDSLGTTPTFDGLSKWRNLWQIAAVAIRETKTTAKMRQTKELLAAVDSSVAKCLPGSTSELNSTFLRLELDVTVAMSKGKLPSASFQAMAKKLPKAIHHLGFDFEGFIRWLEVTANIIPSEPAFESLYDLASELQASRVGEVSAAKMQLDRAETLFESGNQKESIVRLCRAHAHLIKHETRSECIHCLFLLGNLYMRLGLTWAARATFIAAAAIGLQYLMTEDKLHPGLRISLAHLRICAVNLGFLGESLSWHELTRIFHDITFQRTGDSRIIPEEEAKFEILLGRLILRIPDKSRAGLESIPAVLDELDLPIAADLARIKLGADLSILDYMPKPPQGSPLDAIYDMQADLQLADLPADVPVEPERLSTTLFGCRFNFEFENPGTSRHLAEVLLTLIEPIFATAAVGDVYAIQEQVVVRIICSGVPDAKIVLTRLQSDVHADFAMTHGTEVALALWNDPNSLSQKLVECALLIGFGYFISEEVFEDLVTKSDASLFERSYSVSRLISDMKYVTGDLGTLKLSSRLAKSGEVFPISEEKWVPKSTETQSRKTKGKRKVAPLTEEDIRKRASKLRHSEITVVSPIRAALWDSAGWFGVLFAWSPYDQEPPLLAFGFDNAEAGRAIIEGWRQAYGDKLSEHVRISFIRGISRKHPHHYRVLISGHLPGEESTGSVRFFQSVVRIHTMEPPSPQNLNGFLDMFALHGRYLLSTVQREVVTSTDSWDEVLSRGVIMDKLVVREAWEIGRHDPDMAGILLDDDIIVPAGVDNPPVVELLAWKRQRRD